MLGALVAGCFVEPQPFEPGHPENEAPSPQMPAQPALDGGADGGVAPTCGSTAATFVGDGGAAATYACGNASGSGFFSVSAPGAGALTAAQFRAAVTDDVLMHIQGIIGVATMPCCPGSEERCLSLDVQSSTTPVAELLLKLRALLEQAGGACLLVSINVVGATGPRCDGTSEVGCQPIAMCPAASPSDSCCPHHAPYDGSQPRQVVTAALGELSRGECMADGDCVLNGIGNHCTSWQTPGFFAPAVCYPSLADAHCGCVEQRCAWFTQPTVRPQ